MPDEMRPELPNVTRQVERQDRLVALSASQRALMIEAGVIRSDTIH